MLIGIGGISIQQLKGGGSFSPASVAGLQLWLKADAGTLDGSGNPITVDNTAIATWQDQGPNSYSAIQATVGLRPKLRTGANGINGLPVVEAQSDGQLLASATGGLFGNNVTTFLVYSTTGTTGYKRFFEASTTPIFSMAQSPFFSVRRHTFFSSGGGVFVDTTIVAGASPTLITIKANTTAGNPVIANTVYRINKVTLPLTYASVGSLNYSTYAGSVGFQVGIHVSKVAEALVYNQQLSTDNMTAVENYLSAKWGI